MRKVPIGEQLIVARRMLATCRPKMNDEDLEAANGLIRFLEWADTNSETLHIASLLFKDERVQGVLEALPIGTQIAAVRRIHTEPTYNPEDPNERTN